MSSRLLPVLTALVLLAAGCSGPGGGAPSIPEAKVGLRTADVLEASEVAPVAPVSADPGEARRPERPYPGSPPVIPHSVEGLLPITAAENACIDCHSAEAAPDSGAPSIPASHMEAGQLDGRRYLCVFCHAPQTEAAPLLANDFQP